MSTGFDSGLRRAAQSGEVYRGTLVESRLEQIEEIHRDIQGDAPEGGEMDDRTQSGQAEEGTVLAGVGGAESTGG